MVAPAYAQFAMLKYVRLSEELVIRRAILQGEYLYGRQVKVIVSPAGLILDCDAIHCVWSGREQFDAWFRTNYNPLIVVENSK